MSAVCPQENFLFSMNIEWEAAAPLPRCTANIIAVCHFQSFKINTVKNQHDELQKQCLN